MTESRLREAVASSAEAVLQSIRQLTVMIHRSEEVVISRNIFRCKKCQNELYLTRVEVEVVVCEFGLLTFESLAKFTRGLRQKRGLLKRTKKVRDTVELCLVLAKRFCEQVPKISCQNTALLEQSSKVEKLEHKIWSTTSPFSFLSISLFHSSSRTIFVVTLSMYSNDLVEHDNLRYQRQLSGMSLW